MISFPADSQSGMGVTHIQFVKQNTRKIPKSLHLCPGSMPSELRYSSPLANGQ